MAANTIQVNMRTVTLKSGEIYRYYCEALGRRIDLLVVYQGPKQGWCLIRLGADCSVYAYLTDADGESALKRLLGRGQRFVRLCGPKASKWTVTYEFICA